MVTLAVPTGGRVNPAFMIHMFRVTCRIPRDIEWELKVKYANPSTGKVGSTSKIRKEITEEVLAEGVSDHIFFIDPDVFVPLDGLINLLKCDKEIIVGICWTTEEPVSPILYDENGRINNFPENMVFEVSGAGLGCCLIKTEVFRSISKPWFEENDSSFFANVLSHGYTVWCNSAVKCERLREKLPVRFVPGEWLE